MVKKDKQHNEILILDEAYKIMPKASELPPYWNFIGYKKRSLTMTNKETLEILKQWQILAYHNNDRLVDDQIDVIDEDSHNLYLALSIAIPLLEKVINKQKVELTKKSDARKELIEDFERNSFDELYSGNGYTLLNAKISWIIGCFYDDEQISKKTALSLINEVLEGKL